MSKKIDSISQEDFDRELERLVQRDSKTLLSIPGAYEVFSEEYSNEIIDNIRSVTRSEYTLTVKLNLVTTQRSIHEIGSEIHKILSEQVLDSAGSSPGHIACMDPSVSWTSSTKQLVDLKGNRLGTATVNLKTYGEIE